MTATSKSTKHTKVDERMLFKLTPLQFDVFIKQYLQKWSCHTLLVYDSGLFFNLYENAMFDE